MSQIPTVDFLERAIQEAITKEIESAVTEAVNEARERVAKKIPEIVAAVSLRAFQHFSMERMGNDVVLHVRVEGLRL